MAMGLVDMSTVEEGGLAGGFVAQYYDFELEVVVVVLHFF